MSYGVPTSIPSSSSGFSAHGWAPSSAKIATNATTADGCGNDVMDQSVSYVSTHGSVCISEPWVEKNILFIYL